MLIHKHLGAANLDQDAQKDENLFVNDSDGDDVEDHPKEKQIGVPRCWVSMS